MYVENHIYKPDTGEWDRKKFRSPVFGWRMKGIV